MMKKSVCLSQDSNLRSLIYLYGLIQPIRGRNRVKPFFLTFFDPEKFQYLYHRLLDLPTTVFISLHSRNSKTSSQNWTTIATILASKCHHCERTSSQCFKLMLLCSFKPFFLTFLTQTNFYISTTACCFHISSHKNFKNMYKIGPLSPPF